MTKEILEQRNIGLELLNQLNDMGFLKRQGNISDYIEKRKIKENMVAIPNLSTAYSEGLLNFLKDEYQDKYAFFGFGLKTNDVGCINLQLNKHTDLFINILVAKTNGAVQPMIISNWATFGELDLDVINNFIKQAEKYENVSGEEKKLGFGS